MWWSEPVWAVAPRRLWAAALFALLAALSGCGFRPLYAPAGPEAAAPTDLMAAVRINPLPDRAGQQLHNLLRDQLNPGGQPLQPAYVLDLRLVQDTENVGIRKDETATRANLTLSSSFVLRAAEDNRVLYRGAVSSINSYNILDVQYPTDVAEADALARGLRELSEDIKLQLAVFFATADSQDL
jgi:LPS-assembly lipoprotein